MKIKNSDVNVLPRVSVGVLSYNNGRYMEQCLRSIIMQTGLSGIRNFQLKIIISDDNSSDETHDVVQKVMSEFPDTETLSIHYHRNKENLGNSGIANLKQLVGFVSDSDYFCLIDSDDCYSSFYRIAQHLTLHEKYPDILISYNRLQILHEKTEQLINFVPDNDPGDFSETRDLVKENFIGNLGCAFYKSKVLQELPDNLFTLPCFDWFFNTCCSLQTKIMRLNVFLNVYRKHEKGIWSSISNETNRNLLLGYVEEYNKFFNYAFDSEYSFFRQSLYAVQEVDLLLIDDYFPSPHSGFRLQELTSILEAFKNIRVYATGKGVHFFGPKKIEELLADYKHENPMLDAKVQSQAPLRMRAKLLYINFYNATHYLIVAERYAIPFVFTIYPGGGFAVNSPEVDKKLKEIFSSPFFRGVIVTQEVIYNYLIKNNFCPKEKIKFIFGVVTPLPALKRSYTKKARYGFGKDALDICFVAHKYTKHGEDKGYDTFIEVAKLLSKSYENIFFHVVGPWTDEVIDVSDIKDRISFYGSQDQEWFDTFYLDKDIILSPNIPNKIYHGCFDGFPTGCVTDAALREVAMFCTDPLQMNQNRFKNGKEIVIIEPYAVTIVEKIEAYYRSPKKLMNLAIRGSKRVKALYSYEKQIAPRIKVLRKELEKINEYYPVEASREPLPQHSLPGSLNHFHLRDWNWVRSIPKKLVKKSRTAAKLARDGDTKSIHQKVEINVEKAKRIRF